MFDTYRDLLSMRPALARRFRDRIGERMAALLDGRDPWETLAPARLLDHPDLVGMLVYDEQDPEITLAQFEEMASLWTGSRVCRTQGLGHNQILKDRGVIAAITRFLCE